MNGLRTLIMAALALASSSALDFARGEQPLSDAGTSRSTKAEVKAIEDAFLVKPYLQAGHRAGAGRVVLMWHAADADDSWTVKVRRASDQPWTAVADAPSSLRVAVPGVEPHRVYHLPLTGLRPGKTFGYRVYYKGKLAFEAEGRAAGTPDQPQRFVVFGDCGANSPEQKAIAYRTFLAKPDYVMVTGDIVYSRGLISEYRDNFWPIYNADAPSPSTGAPLLRSTLFLAAPGNHDIASRDLGKTPDGLAYFYYWSQPLNGPAGAEGGALVAPVVGPEGTKKAFLAGAGKAFPRMASFSLDYGNVHWTVLDANATVDWTDRALREWVADDLRDAEGAKWRFVCFHQPGFNSSKKHFGEQYMRDLAPVFEAGKVDLVFNGHVHNYQRTYPLTFLPAAKNGAGPGIDRNGRPSNYRRVDGKWTLDKSFDGRADTTPEGVIYVVTGAGGQDLYNPEQQDDPASWQEFTYKHVSKIHSITVADVDGGSLTVRQVTPDGDEVDRFVVTK